MRAPASKISHVDLVVSDVERSISFYLDLLGPLGWSEGGTITGEHGQTVRYLSVSGAGVAAIGLRRALTNGTPGPYDRRAVGLEHLCVDVPSRAVVDERGAWARERGIEIVGGPGEYDYTPGYYAVFLLDPDGLKLELLHRPGFWEHAAE